MASIKRYKIRASAVILFTVLLLTAAAVSVSAYEPCRQAVTRVVTRTEWPHYSKPTIARWLKWNRDHPNYQPPKRQPRLVKEEVHDMVAFACAMPGPEADRVDDLLAENPYEPLSYGFDGPKPYIVAVNERPAFPVALLNVPIVAGPIVSDEAPEPQSWVLALTGLFFVGFCFWKRGQQETEPALIPGV